MQLETWTQVLEFAKVLKKEGPVSLAFAGGDPTAHPDFYGLLQEAQKGFECHIVTHGETLDLPKLAELRNLESLHVQVSLPSINPDEYKRLTGGGDISNSLKNLMGLKLLRIPTSISSVVTKINCGNLGELIDLAAAINARQVLLNRFVDEGRGAYYGSDYSLCDTEFFEVTERALSYALTKNVKVLAPKQNLNIREIKQTDVRITITKEGGIKFCSITPELAASVCDDANTIIESYLSFWKSSKTMKSCRCSETPTA